MASAMHMYAINAFNVMFLISAFEYFSVQNNLRPLKRKTSLLKNVIRKEIFIFTLGNSLTH